MAALVESLPEPRVFVSGDYRILAVNKAYRDLFGDPCQGKRRLCYEISHKSAVPCDQAGESCPLKASRESGETSRVLHIHHTPNGPEHVDVEVSPIRNREGRVLFYVETLRTVRHAYSRPSADGLVGRSPAFNRMLALLERVAPSDVTVLLLGESGTGKELAALALHAASTRARGQFVAVDCASMTETLFGSELFGYEKGAFTGAISRRAGLVEAASGGTLFIDEIGDMPLCMQVKLLRLIESGTFRRVGGVEPLRADFRLVLATHRDLKAMVADGTFRRDLYYRISAFPIAIPPLRERREDLPLLAESLLSRVSKRRLRLHPQVLEQLGNHDFPGNIRELRNILERASLLVDGESILPEHLDTSMEPAVAAAARDARAEGPLRPLAEVERRYLRWALENHGEDRRTLAAKLGISERTLYRKLKEATDEPSSPCRDGAEVCSSCERPL
ncbi:MAG: sigma 54-interacting transcriptional regulator [Rhodocyclaceae bacterium]|nr:sigma 54-interacting transcriptional regulator [Rhodocyclaceae bacterium]